MDGSARDLERYLREHIPLTGAMGVRVQEAAPDRVLLFAPLGPNINHRDTVFGGSAASLAVLAAWALLHLRLQAAGIEAALVIQRNEMRYERPIPGDFTASCELADGAQWERFRSTLARRGRARIELPAVLWHEGEPAARFSGEFVALRR